MSGDGGNGHAWATEGALDAVAADVRRLREDQDATRKRVAGQGLDVHTLKTAINEVELHQAARFDALSVKLDSEAEIRDRFQSRTNRMLEMLCRAHGIEVPTDE